MTLFNANGFRSDVPAGWQDGSTISLVGPLAADGFAANLVVTRQALATGTTATQFGRQQVEALAGEVDALVVEDERTTTFQGREMFQRLHTFSVGTQAVRQMQTYLVQESAARCTGFVITGTTSPDSFDESMVMFRQFVEHFEFVEPACP